MDLIQLKMPPERASAMADAIERDIKAHPTDPASAELRKTLVWLRYRVQRFDTHHPVTPAE